jgi:hypothetical protein
MVIDSHSRLVVPTLFGLRSENLVRVEMQAGCLGGGRVEDDGQSQRRTLREQRRKICSLS